MSEWFYRTVFSLLGLHLEQDRCGQWSTIGVLSDLGINQVFLLHLSLLCHCSSVFFLRVISCLSSIHRPFSRVLLDEISVLVTDRYMMCFISMSR